MSRSNEFAQAFANAHTEAGLQRVSIAHILQKVQSDPSFIFSEELRTGAGLCPMRRKTDADDADKVTVNTLLAYLFERLRDHIAKALPLDEARRVMLPIPPRSPHGLDPADRAAMAAASATSRCLRMASSISTALMVQPAEMMTSSARPPCQK